MLYPSRGHNISEGTANFFQTCSRENRNLVKFCIHCLLSKTTMVIQWANSHAGYYRSTISLTEKFRPNTIYWDCLFWLSSSITNFYIFYRYKFLLIGSWHNISLEIVLTIFKWKQARQYPTNFRISKQNASQDLKSYKFKRRY